jgi:hypothetical protein
VIRLVKLRPCSVLGCATLIPPWRPGCWRHVLAHGAALCALLTLGCGSITLAPSELVAVDASALDGGTLEARPAAADAGPHDEGGATGPTVDAGLTPEAPPSCAEACAPCAPYPCAAVISCARSADAGAYPWQSCHNIVAGPGPPFDGLMCSMRVGDACR